MLAAVTCKLHLYADDSSLLVLGSDVHKTGNTLRKELETVSQCLVENTISIHLVKTESILFGTKRKESKSNALKVMGNDTEIVSQSSVTYLGLILEQSLCESIAKILAKCASKLKFCIIRQGFLISLLRNYLFYL